MDAATVKYDEAMNVKLLLREICQFLDCSREGPGYTDTGRDQLRNLASKVLFALSLNNFGAVFSRISGRLQELSVSNEEREDHTDIELIQHINVDIGRLTKLMAEAIAKFRQLKKNAHLVLMVSLEKAVWNWMDTYPHVSILLLPLASSCSFLLPLPDPSPSLLTIPSPPGVYRPAEEL